MQRVITKNDHRPYVITQPSIYKLFFDLHHAINPRSLHYTIALKQAYSNGKGNRPENLDR